VEVNPHCAAPLVLIFFAASKDFRPGLRRVFGVEACLLEGVLVVVEDRRGRIVREGQHGAVRLGIIGDDASQILASLSKV
jgi:hypothetical protein